MENVSTMGDKVWMLVTTHGVRVVGVLVALFLAWIVAGMISRWVTRGMEKAKIDVTLSRFMGNLTRYAILVMAIVGCLGVFGIQTASFAAVIAAAGFAVGMGFQGTLGNLSSGVMLLIFRPFKIGNFVNVAGVMGTVTEIELFTTTLTTPDNKKIIVPNGSIFGSTIENITFNPTRRVDISVGVVYSADIDRCREVLDKAADAIPSILTDPPKQIFLSSLGASSVDWVVRVWCNTENYWDVYQEGIRQVKRHLDEAGIGIPFPQMDIHFDPPIAEGLSDRKVKDAHA